MDSLGIDGAWITAPQIFQDSRGRFLEWFRSNELAEAVGHPFSLAQANCSISRRGVLRGIHFADVPPGQAKYVTCLRGTVVDIVVDLRVGSPNYGRWEAARLDDESRQALFVSEGLGHGFMALSDEATVVYLCSTHYAPGREHGVHPLDPALGIVWPADVAPVLSEKDATAPSLDEAERAGLLPDYKKCLAYAELLRNGSGR